MIKKSEQKLNIMGFSQVQTGSFHQWYEIYREEGYEPEQAESMAQRSAQSNQFLPNWYLNPEPKPAYSPSDCPEDNPF